MHRNTTQWGNKLETEVKINEEDINNMKKIQNNYSKHDQNP